jgi:hypothetical protein
MGQNENSPAYSVITDVQKWHPDVIPLPGLRDASVIASPTDPGARPDHEHFSHPVAESVNLSRKDAEEIAIGRIALMLRLADKRPADVTWNGLGQDRHATSGGRGFTMRIDNV